jgi:hypothetical protein
MKLSLIYEGYGRVYNMLGTYLGYNDDPTPKVLSLGRWISPKGNKLLAGINLHYLSDDQTSRLQKNLGTILKDRNLRRRVRKLRSLIPDVFDSAYRTYDTQKINGQVTKGTLKFVKPGEFIKGKRKPGMSTDPSGDEIPDTGPVGKVSDKIKQRHDSIKGINRDEETEIEDDDIKKSESEFERTVDDVKNNKKKSDKDDLDQTEEEEDQDIENKDEIIPDEEIDDDDEDNIELEQ